MSVPPLGGSHVQMLLGAYVFGALSRDDDRYVADHLSECDECSAEYLDMADVPCLLSLVTETDLVEGLGPAGRDDASGDN